MTSIQNYTKIQVDLLQKIEKAHINFKKSPKERISVGYCQGRLEALETYWTEFKGNHEKIIVCVTEDEEKSLYFKEEVFDAFEERYYIYKGDLKNVLGILNAKHADQTQTHPNKSSCNELKLPQIQIPSFCGNYTEWQEFHDLFTALIDTNPSLQNVQKLHYLKASLKGDAEVLLRQFSITEDNYEEAWSVLKRRYDNKRYIANTIFKKFFGQKALVQESAAGLKQLLDTSVECMNALKLLGLPATHWDAIVNYVIVSKLDTGSHKYWEEQISGDESQHFPSFERLKSFLETRFQTLEMVQPVCKGYRPISHKTFHVTANNTSGDLQCAFCEESHYIFNCKQFIKLSVEERYDFVKKNNLCFNCLIPSHKIFHCKQKTSCQVCGRRHHSLLHRDMKQSEDKSGNKAAQSTNNEVTKVVAHVRSSGEEEESHNVLLATALVDIKSRSGEIQVCRALLDQGSEASFVTAQLAELLNLDKTAISGTVSGLGDGNSVCINQKVGIQIMSRYETDFSVKVNAYVLESLTSRLPSREIKGYVWPQLDNMKLADPTFNKPGKIDILLGADVFGKIIDSGFMRGPGNVVAQHTHLGWILSGNTNTTFSSQQNITSFHVTRKMKEDNNLKRRFWEIEEFCTNKKTWYDEEQVCKEVNKNATKVEETEINEILHLPLKLCIDDTWEMNNDTKQQAVAMFKESEGRFDRREEVKNDYTRDKVENVKPCETIQLLSHDVLQNTVIKGVLVCFEALIIGNEGISTKNAVTTTLVQTGFSILMMHYRATEICVIDDVVKRNHQMRKTNEHTDLQCIEWENEPYAKVECYRFVTFGTGSTPYLDVQTCYQQAEDETEIHTHIAPIVIDCSDTDDMTAKQGNETEIKRVCHEINSLLKAGGIDMKKWPRGSYALIELCRDSRTLQKPEKKRKVKLDKMKKILHIRRNKEDRVKIKLNLPKSKTSALKGLVISNQARLQVASHWFAPVIVTTLGMTQRLLLDNLSWNDELTTQCAEEWMTYRRGLLELQTAKSKYRGDDDRWRHVQSTDSFVEIDLKGTKTIKKVNPIWKTGLEWLCKYRVYKKDKYHWHRFKFKERLGGDIPLCKKNSDFV